MTDAEKIYREGLLYDANHAGIWIGLVNLHLAKMEDNGEENTKERKTRAWWPSGNQECEAQSLESKIQKTANYWKAREEYKKAESILQRRRGETKDIIKLKVAGIELEKSAVEQITTSGSLGISK